MIKISRLHRAGALLCASAAILAAALPAAAQLPSINDATDGMERADGFVPFYWDAEEARLLLEISQERLDQDFLYLTSLATGIGSLSLGLDRGAIGDEAVVHFERLGPKIFFVRTNTSFRAVNTENEMLELSVEESFPTSNLAALEIVAASGDRVVVDATEFFLRDAMDVRGSLRRDDQGSFSVDGDRSAIFMARTKAFPENTEIEAIITFTSDDPGPEIRRHTPDGRSMTIRQHHSLVQLPEPYQPRAFHPRVGLFGVEFRDFARPLTESYAQRWIVRWRLEKEDPSAAISDPVEPIVYYLDRGIPEPYRTAFREGAEWWSEVFEAAGFSNAYRVEDLPEGVDPLDARYSVIQWVHRTEPGFSIGPSFIDPRTGEILKAAVRMDSYRSLVDFNIWGGASPAVTAAAGMGELFHCELGGGSGLPDWVVDLDPNTDPVEFAMARRRQHSAHEVGHTLGLAHNFTTSTYGRASVMDYPPPRMLITDGRVDLTDAYRPGPGAYDSLAIRYAYTTFADGGEDAGLAGIVDEAIADELLFITDTYARPAGASDPRATLWDDGEESVAAFSHALDVRRLLLASFGQAAIADGEPLALLRDRLAPAYLHHRYALDAAVRTVGGMEFTYAVKGDGQTPTRIIDASRQRAALSALVGSLAPGELALPEGVLALLAPYPFGYSAPRRGFRSAAAPAFDQLGAARSLAAMTIGGILQPQRAARVVAFQTRQADALTLDEVMSEIIAATWRAREERDPYLAALLRVTQRVALDELLDLAANESATPEVRGAAEWHLSQLADQIGQFRPSTPEVGAHHALAIRDIRRFLGRLDAPTGRSEPLQAPPGSPIGNR